MKENHWVAIFLLLASVWYGVTAMSFTGSTLSDPVGPRVFPLALAIGLGVCSVIMFARSPDRAVWPGSVFWLSTGKIASCLIGYVLCLNWLGFVLTTSLVMFLLALIFDGPWLQSIIGSVLFSVSLYLLFVFALGLKLPMGVWWG